MLIRLCNNGPWVISGYEYRRYATEQEAEAAEEELNRIEKKNAERRERYNKYAGDLELRNTKVYSMRLDGQTYRKIAYEIGVSENRARQIFVSMEKKMSASR